MVSSARVAGFLFLVWLAAAAGANGWLASAYVGPLRDAHAVDYIIQLPPVWLLAAWIAGCLCTLSAIQVLRFRRQWTHSWLDAFEWRRARYLAPLSLLSFPPLAVALLFTPWSSYAVPWLFLFLDLKRWLLLGVAVMLAGSVVSNFSGQRVRDATTRGFRWLQQPAACAWLEAALIVVLVVLSLNFSPGLRFQSVVVGDEPKYLRFLENWYQGNGFDISRFRNIGELPANLPPNMPGNMRQLGASLSEVGADLASDLRHAVGGSAAAPPRATVGGNWFLEGKRGGVYQVHNPGVSVLLFPGYLIDRYLLNWTAQFNPQLPSNLYVTGGTVLLIYLVWAAAIFRLVSRYTGNPLLAWFLTVAAMASMPAAAFSYQYYPESAGGLLLTVVTCYVMLSTDTRWTVAVMYGFLAGYLPWLHPRFGPVTALAAVAYALTRRHATRAVACFWIGVAFPLIALGLYNYSIAGNPLPWALYNVVADGPGFDLNRAVRDLPRFWTDPRAGLIAYTPLYVLVLAGLFPMWRRRTDMASFLSILVVLLAFLAAAHNWHGAATTPGRLVAGVVPLLTLMVAEGIAQLGYSRTFVVVACVLGAVSVHNGLAYDSTFVRFDTAFRGASVSGLTVPFPLFSEGGVGGHATTVLAWTAASLMLIVWPALRGRLKRRGSMDKASWTAVAASVLLTFAVGGSVATAAGRMPPRHLVDEASMREGILRTHLDHDGGITWSARRGLVDPKVLFPNPAHGEVRVESRAAPAGKETYLRILAGDSDGQTVWGRAKVDFGDRTPPAYVSVIGLGGVAHVYRAGGVYSARVVLTQEGATSLTTSSLINVPRTSEELLRGIPTALKIEAITIGDSHVEVRCERTGAWREAAGESHWVWIHAADGGSGQGGRFYQADVAGSSTDGAHLTLRATLDRKPADGQLTVVIAGSTPTGSRSSASNKGSALTVRWPASTLTMGAPLRLDAAEAAR